MKNNVVSLSGGKDSTAMLLMLLERGETVQDVVYYDTGMDFPEMYDHILKLESYTGLKFTRLRMQPSFEHQMFIHRKTRGKRKGEPGYGWPTPKARWCTTRKTYAIDKYISKTLNNENLQHCVGIAFDEKRTISKNIRYPLIEWKITESEALKYCYEKGFDWGGLYEYEKRVSCWCCPLQCLDDLRGLRKMHPELWIQLADMDAMARNQFRFDYSVAELEIKFNNEDLWR